MQLHAAPCQWLVVAPDQCTEFIESLQIEFGVVVERANSEQILQGGRITGVVLTCPVLTQHIG